MYKIESLGSLWLEAELYSNEINFVKQGDKVTVRVNGFESTPLESKVAFLSPEYRTNSQVVVMRAVINNPLSIYKPGMQAQVFFSHSGKTGISIPVDAVIRTSSGSHVFVQTGQNTFRPRVIKTGIEDFNQVEVTEGLMENEIIAASGAYLIYSEIVLKHGDSIKF